MAPSSASAGPMRICNAFNSLGSVWLTNRLGSSLRWGLVVAEMILTLKTGGNADEKLTRAMAKQTGGDGIDSCFGVPTEVLSTRCGGQGVTIFFGMAKPVRAPQIGPAQAR
jgi:hypothetical protein